MRDFFGLDLVAPLKCWGLGCGADGDGRLGLCAPCATAYEATLWQVRDYAPELAEDERPEDPDWGSGMSVEMRDGILAHAAVQTALWGRSRRARMLRALEGFLQESRQRGHDDRDHGVNPATLTLDAGKDRGR